MAVAIMLSENIFLVFENYYTVQQKKSFMSLKEK